MEKKPLLTENQIVTFQALIFSWWEKNRRDLPWRHTRDPYKILVSELMLQQTQVSRVLPKYKQFLDLFPTVNALATASTADVLRAWKGMGYNRRALYLKKLSQIIVQKYNNIFPDQEKILLELPGLGKYTARAVLVFAMKKDIAMIDTNIRQIIVHHFFDDVPQKESIIQHVADQLVPPGKSWEWHQALMDYGSLELTVILRRKSKDLTKAVRVKEISANQYKIPQSSLPFRQTNRFIRGRIIDILREEAMKETELIRMLEKKYSKPKDFLDTILKGLLSDGLIERSKTGIISLPH